MANYSNYDTFIKKSENGVRINFTYRENCQLVDVVKDKTVSYFLLFYPEGEPHFMELTAAEAFELLATHYHVKREHEESDEFYHIMDHTIEEILYNAKE